MPWPSLEKRGSPHPTPNPRPEVEDIALSRCIAPKHARPAGHPTAYGLEYQWDEGAGRAAMTQALEIVDQAANHAVRLFDAPAQYCTASSSSEPSRPLKKRNAPIQIPCSTEHRRVPRDTPGAHGVTAIAWLDAHAGSSLYDGATTATASLSTSIPLRWPMIERLARAGASVAQHLRAPRHDLAAAASISGSNRHNFIDQAAGRR